MLDQILLLWHNFLSVFDAIQEDTIAITVYLGGAIIALWLWAGVCKRFPNPMGGILWIIVFACLATPTISEGNNAGLAPALIGVVFGLLTKDHALLLSNLSAILCVAGLGFSIGFCWSKYQGNKAQHADPSA